MLILKKVGTVKIKAKIAEWGTRKEIIHQHSFIKKKGEGGKEETKGTE